LHSKRAYFGSQKSLFRNAFKPILEAERASLGKVKKQKGKKVNSEWRCGVRMASPEGAALHSPERKRKVDKGDDFR